MPFKKGQSGNPAGRQPGVSYASFKERAKAFMDRDGAEALVEMARSEGDDRRFALKLLTEYAYGKPTQPITGDPDQPLAIRVVYENGPITSAASDPGAHHR